MRRVELFLAVAVAGRAEAACGTDQHGAHLGGELGLHLAPVVLDVLPGLGAGFGNLQGDGKLDGRVLVANLARGGVVKRALDQGRVFKLGQQAQCALLKVGIGGGLVDLLQPVEERGVAVLGSHSEGGLAQGGID